MTVKTRKKILIGVLVILLALFALYFNAGKKTGQIEYGVTFSPYQAESLGLNWKEVYLQMLADLKLKNIRISAYWDKVEPRADEYNFEDLDFQVKNAEDYGVRLVLAIGRRLPRWPECHNPSWLNEKTLQADVLSYIEAVVRRYQNSPAVEMWQVENEPFLSSFGECPPLNPELLDREIALVKTLDPARKVLISDSGELSLWLESGRRGDVFGTTLYRYVYSDVFNRYWINYNPYWLYRVKGGFLRFLNGDKNLVIIELQAEPWTTQGIVNTPIQEQFRTMSMEKFNKMLSLGQAIGFERQYLWGVEWWYWMKQKNHPEFWEKAREIMSKN